jgi:hypothetical protein
VSKVCFPALHVFVAVPSLYAIVLRFLLGSAQVGDAAAMSFVPLEVVCSSCSLVLFFSLFSLVFSLFLLKLQSWPCLGPIWSRKKHDCNGLDRYFCTSWYPLATHTC